MKPIACVLLLATAACVPPAPKPPQPPPPSTPRVLVATVRTPSGDIVRDGTASLIDDFQHVVPCVWGGDRLTCTPIEGLAQGTQGHLQIADVPDMEPYDQGFLLAFDAIQDLGEIHLRAIDPPLLDKTTLIRTAQENFGGIKVRDCGLHRDNLFDPFLLERWATNRPCFDRMLAEHARRNDNTVSIDPASGYGGQNAIDLWHDPQRFAAFVRDVRRHTNARGEHFRVRLFLGGDAHIATLREPGAWDHWSRDVRALAAVVAPYVEFTVPCWECRHAQWYASAKQYYNMLRVIAQIFPRSVHSVHLQSESSAPSSWPCDPETPPCAGPPVEDADDPALGSEPGAWVYMLDHGLVDEFLYQFDTYGPWMYWSTYPPNPEAVPSLDTRGALSRWWDIVVRLGDDPWSVATAQTTPGYSDRRGWRQIPIKAWEGIYDFYWDRDPSVVTEAFLAQMCQRALAIGGWGCGFASVRR